MKENYDSFQKLFEMINYTNYKWKICCDLKVVNILCGLKQGFPHFFCFKCDWDTRTKEDHYTYKGWTGKNPDIDPKASLAKIEDILLPPLHMKLGIVSKFLKLLVMKNTNAFACLKRMFKVSDSKIKGGKCLFIHYSFLHKQKYIIHTNTNTHAGQHFSVRSIHLNIYL